MKGPTSVAATPFLGMRAPASRARARCRSRTGPPRRTGTWLGQRRAMEPAAGFASTFTGPGTHWPLVSVPWAFREPAICPWACLGRRHAFRASGHPLRGICCGRASPELPAVRGDLQRGGASVPELGVLRHYSRHQSGADVPGFSVRRRPAG